jgi:5-carboxymethyl-2-hydroxymuconate isomerase
MPSILIEVRRRYTQEEEVALMEAVHRAVRESFQILPGDKNVRLIVHEPHRFACPSARSKPEAYTHISIDAFAGRSLEAKRKLYLAIVAELELFGIPREDSLTRIAEGKLGNSRRPSRVRCGTWIQGGGLTSRDAWSSDRPTPERRALKRAPDRI